MKLLVSAAFVCVSCSWMRAETLPIPSSCKGSGGVFTAVTFNPGLAPGVVPLSSLRAPYVAQAVAQSKFDVLCLQEVWRQEDVDAVISALSLPEENVFYEDTAGEHERGNVCSMDNLSPLFACAIERCGRVPSEDVTICAAERCFDEGRELYRRDRGCFDCVTASVGKSIPEIMNTCRPGGKGASRLYGGKNGVILASRWPLTDREAVRLPSSGVNRVVLLSRIRGPGKEPIEVGCTHLSSHQKVSPTYPGFASWTDEQIAQVRLVSDKLKDRAVGRPTLLLGDMNAGPAGGSQVSEASPQTWQEILRQGFVSPAVWAEPPICSSCADNTLNDLNRSYLLDHVLVRDKRGRGRLVPVCASALFDEPFVIRGRSGEPITTFFSDHLAVMVQFSYR